MGGENNCPIDGSPNEICGGPHREIFTDLGWEVLAPSEQPKGIPEEPTAEDEARRWSILRKGRIGD